MTATPPRAAGRSALDGVEGQDVNLTIVENGSPLDAHYRCTSEPSYRIDIFSGGHHVFCEGLDTQGPWLWPSADAAAHDAVPDARRTAIEGIEFNLYGLHRFPERGHQLELLDRETVDGVNYFVVRVIMKDAYETFLYIDPSNWMIGRRRDFRAFHPDIDATRRFTEKRYEDYRPVSGVMTSFREQQIDLVKKAVVNETMVHSLHYMSEFAPGELSRNAVRPDLLQH